MSTVVIPLHSFWQTPNDSTATLAATPVDYKPKGDLELSAPSNGHNLTHVHVIPDGGLRAWCSVAGSFLLITCTFGWANAFGVFQTYYIEELLPSYSPSSISWIGSVQLFLLWGVGLFAGKLFDAQRVRVGLAVGSVLLVGCIFALSAVNEDQYYAIFLCQGIGQGVGEGLLYLPALALNAHHFQKKRALALGIAVCGSSIGGIIFPILLNNVFQTSGFRPAVRATGYVVLACLVLANLLVSTNYDPNHKAMPKPSLLKFLREDKIYVVSLFGAFFLFWGVFMVFFYMPLFAATHGISESLSFYTIAIINAAALFGRIIPNVIADRTGPLILIVPLMTVTVVLVWALFGVASEGSVIVYCLLYGFFSGGIFSLSPPIIASLCNSMNEYGTRLGGSMLVTAFASLTGVPISGALVGWEPPYSWWKAIVFSGITMGAGTAFLAWAWVLQWKKKGTYWC